MIRLAAVVLVLSAAAAAAATVVFVDGEEIAVLEVVSASPETTVLVISGRTWEVPTANLVAVRFGESKAEATSRLFNLYLADGGRLHGTVTGSGNRFVLESATVQGLAVPLAAVRAVRFGRLLHGLQTKYDEVFAGELARGRDAVIVQRDTRPFPIAARVLAVSNENLTVLVGDDKRDLPLHKVYGFVRRIETPEEEEEARPTRVRLHLAGGAHVTLPLESITKGGLIKAGGASVQRDAVHLIEFEGSQVGHVGNFDPIAVEERGLFGKALPWRRDAMVLGGPLRLDGRRYERGIGVHAFSRLEFVLSKRWRAFFVRCGIDDAAGGEGEAVFRVLGDGKLLKEVRCRRRGKQGSMPILLDVSGVDRLVLEVDPGDSHTSDLCDWAEARVFNAEPIEYPKRGP